MSFDSQYNYHRIRKARRNSMSIEFDASASTRTAEPIPHIPPHLARVIESVHVIHDTAGDGASASTGFKIGTPSDDDAIVTAAGGGLLDNVASTSVVNTVYSKALATTLASASADGLPLVPAGTPLTFTITQAGSNTQAGRIIITWYELDNVDVETPES